MLRHAIAGIGAVALAMACAGTALPDAPYPTKLITIVVPFSAGGAGDLFSRLVADQLRPSLGQPIIIENKTGASGNIGAESVSRAPADGYTLLTAPQLTFSINHLLNPNLRFDPRAMEPISVLATYPFVLFARSDLPANSVSELIAHAKANPGKLSYASQGQGQLGHLAMEALKLRADVDILHVPYRGTVPAMNDLLGGQVDLLADSLLAGMQHVQSGKLKLLAVGGKERLKAFPNVATFAETLPSFYCDTWMAMAAPPGTPKKVTQLLSDAIARVLQSPDLKRRLAELQVEPFGSTPDQMAALIKESHDRWAPVIAKANITVE